ncbi:ATP synthase F0 subunit B [Gemmata sp. G18]|uniref:ATP synthase subunit b n=1 Tax=Gemmata palustris TaxID=2822762 RepID=A0ABS5BJD6_9BACT|nr:ATP synthase F0 subunit B [Gemmata palustris]MBP3953811.1 ATP synthase F0 subunit B [Gemmata palustris]
MTTFVRTAGAIAVVLLLPALAPAADAPGAQKNILAPDLVNSIVTVVVFGALLAILYTFAWGPILKGLQAREEAQFQAIADAKKAKEEAAALRTQLAAELAKAADQVRAIMDEARRDADALKIAEREVGIKEAQAERERASRDLAIERDALLNEVSQRAVDLASIMATKAIRQQVTIEKQSSLVSESIAEVNTSASRA